MIIEVFAPCARSLRRNVKKEGCVSSYLGNTQDCVRRYEAERFVRIILVSTLCPPIAPLNRVRDERFSNLIS